MNVDDDEHVQYLGHDVHGAFADHGQCADVEPVLEGGEYGRPDGGEEVRAHQHGPKEGAGPEKLET